MRLVYRANSNFRASTPEAGKISLIIVESASFLIGSLQLGAILQRIVRTQAATKATGQAASKRAAQAAAHYC